MTGAALVLAGCGKKGDFEKAINAKIGLSKTCFSLRKNNVTFPAQLSKPRFDETGTIHPPFVGKNAIELPLPIFLPANVYGFEWFLVNEGELEERDNQ